MSTMANSPYNTAGVTDLATSAFDSALDGLEAANRNGNAVEALASSLTALGTAAGLSGRERDRRAQLLVGRVSPTSEQVREIAARVRDSAPSVLNALRAALPPELRAIAVLRPATTTVGEPPGGLPGEAAGDAPSSPRERTTTVILVGTADEQANNAALLESNGMHSIRVSDIDSLLRIAADGVCGFVIASSAWVGHQIHSQRELVARACSFSTFVFVRIATEGLAAEVAAAIHDIATEALCGPADVRRFCHGSACGLTPADVDTIRRAARMLESADAAGFLPLEASDGETCLLRLVASQRRGSLGGSAIRTRELAGGRSGAKLFLLQPPSAMPFVVKLGTPDVLSDELKRHQRWIADWEPQVTAPTLHLHMGAAAVSYRLQTAAEQPERPAPTLEDRLEKLVASEWLREFDADGAARELESTLRAAAGRLAALNCRKAEGQGKPFWLDWPAKGLAERGVTFTVSKSGSSPVNLAEVCHIAMKKLAPFMDKGVVHGDIHARNVLLVDGAPAFIDYTYSGPGNPLVDLVRLDACVRSIAMRAWLDEPELITLLKSIYVEGLPAEAVISGVGGQVSASSRLAVFCAATVRSKAIEVAAAHGAGVPEYLAMVAVVSAYLISVRSPASAVERACLRAVAPSVVGD